MNTRHLDTPADWADSMAHWAEENAAELRHFAGQAHRALPLPADRMWVAPHRAFVPQGCDQQGWQVPTIPVVIDRLPEAFDPPETQAESADREVFIFMAKVVAAIVAAAYLITTYAGR